MKLKSILFAIIGMAFFLSLASHEAEAQVQWDKSVGYQYLAKDSTIVNSAQKHSAIKTIYYKSGAATDMIAFARATITVISRQVVDSLRATVYLCYGQITGGTAGTTYDSVYVDSLYTGHHSTIIQLTNYLLQPEVRLSVLGKSAGNSSGVPANVPKWRAIFSGVAEKPQ